MIKRRNGGMIEYIPSPGEKRERLIHDHTFNLMANLHERIRRIEESAGLSLDAAEDFEKTLERIRIEEGQTKAINDQMRADGAQHE